MRAVLVLCAAACFGAHAAAELPAGAAMSRQAAIVIAESAVLRAAPRDSAAQQATLWPGELLEVRAERLDYLQVYDHRRERAGFVRASQVRRTVFAAAEAPELLAVLRFVRDTPGSEALGIGIAMAYLEAAPAQALRGAEGIEAFDALGTLADRLGHRASFGGALGKPAQAALAGHLEVAMRYGLRFDSHEREGRIQVCYDGEAFRRVLALDSQPPQRARAALALTRPECVDPGLPPPQRAELDRWRAEVLDRVDPLALPAYQANRVRMRRASLWSAIAYQQARQGQPAAGAAQRALAELAGVRKDQLTEVDLPAYNDAAMRTNASRWAALDAPAPAAPSRLPGIVTVAGQPGETCVLLVDAKHDASRPLARRCTYALVWAQSATLNREANALALAVQPMQDWRELWVFRRQASGGWTVDVLPPATTNPELGYAEFAGWVPGGRQMLVAREARGEGRYKREFELVRIDALATERRAADPDALGAFRRWQDPLWKRTTVSLR